MRRETPVQRESAPAYHSSQSWTLHPQLPFDCARERERRETCSLGDVETSCTSVGWRRDGDILYGCWWCSDVNLLWNLIYIDFDWWFILSVSFFSPSLSLSFFVGLRFHHLHHQSARDRQVKGKRFLPVQQQLTYLRVYCTEFALHTSIKRKIKMN